MGRVLEFEDSFEILAKAMSSPWNGPIESSFTSRPIQWEQAGKIGKLTHYVTRCARSNASCELCFICLHRLVLDHHESEDVNATMEMLSLNEDLRCQEDAASNIGGYHSMRNLLMWKEVASSPLPGLLENAIDIVTKWDAERR